MSQSIQDYFENIITLTGQPDYERTTQKEFAEVLMCIRQTARAAIQQINKPKPQPPRQQALL